MKVKPYIRSRGHVSLCFWSTLLYLECRLGHTYSFWMWLFVAGVALNFIGAIATKDEG